MWGALAHPVNPVRIGKILAATPHKPPSPSIGCISLKRNLHVAPTGPLGSAARPPHLRADRGFDVYAFSTCSGASCVAVPVNTPGQARGGGQAKGELAEFTILEGTAVGGRAQFSFDVSYVAVGRVHFRDRDSETAWTPRRSTPSPIQASRATITGRATVDGVAGVRFVLEVEDLGAGGADAFRLVTATGYGAFGVVDKGNITVRGGGLLTVP